jgi:hypothetical protein
MCWMTLTAWAARAIIRAANATGGCLHRLDIRTVSLDEDSLLEAARRETGLEDFGGDEFREPLRLVLHGLETEAHLTLLGRVVARRDLLGLLTNRLRLARDRARNPGIAEQRIVRPFFIIGLPRTGTTLLHHLISQDSASRSPQAWEVMAPSPPPEEARYETDPRIDDAEQVAVAANAVGLLADDDAGLAVGLVADETVHHVGADLFQRACPPDVGLLVEARLQLDEDGDLLAALGRAGERLGDRRGRTHPVERHLDGQHLDVDADARPQGVEKLAGVARLAHGGGGDRQHAWSLRPRDRRQEALDSADGRRVRIRAARWSAARHPAGSARAPRGARESPARGRSRPA